MTDWIIKDLAAGVKEEDIFGALGNCYCVESHEGHGIDSLSLTYAGTIYAAPDPKHLYIIYQNSGGGYWYETMIETERGLVTPHEHIFGTKERRTADRRRKGK